MKSTLGTIFAFLAIASFMIAPGQVYGAHADDPMVDIPEGVGLCTEDNVDCYLPTTITVRKGTTVTWTNSDSTTPIHTITSGVISDRDNVGAKFNSEFISQGDSFEHLFDEVGEHPYFCMLHPRMAGIVIVEDAHAAGDDHMVENTGDNDMMTDDDEMMTGDGDHMSGMTPDDDNMDGENMIMDSTDGMDGGAPGDGMDRDMMDMDMEEMEMMMMENGMMMTTSDGEVMVRVMAMSSPTAGEPLDIMLQFTDSEGNMVDHVNYDVLVSQGNSRVASERGSHSHEGMSSLKTMPLSSDSGVDVNVTLQGIGLPGTPLAERSGPVGEMVEFSDVPEFGAVAVLVLVVAIVSIVAVTARSSVFQRI